MVPCSAKLLAQGKPEPAAAAALAHALEWLIDAVAARRAALQARVDRDVTTRARKQEEAQQQRKLERARREAEEAAAAAADKKA
mgnify:CR=1 FL=1